MKLGARESYAARPLPSKLVATSVVPAGLGFSLSFGRVTRRAAASAVVAAARQTVTRTAATAVTSAVASERISAPFAAASLAPRAPIAPRAVIGEVLGGIFGGTSPAEKTRQQYAEQLARVNRLEPIASRLSDAQLRGTTRDLQQRVQAGESLDSVLPEAFAVVREASKRVLGLRPFDVQLIGGMVLHDGQIAEMRTGEGKTLVAVLPAYLNALTGRGVHVVTVNDYLARRDAEWVGQIHKYLGLSVGLIQQGMTAQQRRESYACDVTYVTNSELGFDYLRDNLATSKADLVVPSFNFCIIDEVDSILIDEARTPLIISGPAEKPSERYLTAAKIAQAFERDTHYTVDEKQKLVLLTEIGYEEAELVLKVTDLYDPREQWASFIINAIKAKELFIRDVQYIVRDGAVLIVDEFTGRIMEGRRWSEGVHQAVEAKEGVVIQNETVSLASISYQNFFLQYPKLCGMTGTAATEADEFESIYKLAVAEVPTNRPLQRKDEQDSVYRTSVGKWKAVVADVMGRHAEGRPVLVGTTSVEISEALSAKLKQANVPHQVLNAKPENVEREAEIVAQSGRVGAVTIATNMAGRGTDILLGGNAEFMARLKLREALMPRVVKADDTEYIFQGKTKVAVKRTWTVPANLFPCQLSADFTEVVAEAVAAAVEAWGANSQTALEAEDRLAFACEKGPTSDPVIKQLRAAFEAVEGEYKRFTEEEKQRVIAAGGLHVIGTERHESRRVDNQLRGRSGRQGDPGSSRFFLSLEDNLLRVFGGERIDGLMRAFHVEDLPIESPFLNRALEDAQRKVENYYFDIRKQLFEYDQVLNSQRDRFYSERRRALETEDMEGLMLEYAELTMDDIVNANIDPSESQEEWNFEALTKKVKQYCALLTDLSIEDIIYHSDTVDSLRGYLHQRSRDAYYRKRAEVEAAVPGLMRDAERYFVLTQMDLLWKEHLQALRFTQQAVALRGYAQRDPLIEYKLEGYNLFLAMMGQIRRNVIYSVYQFNPVLVSQPDAAQGLGNGEDKL
ncbi:hypothetical protein CLOM_g2845 [Closterium sp. NIES-68]|nr:hypothetical protein CLOM_g2845 [Closterium sp. NIES-68]GJP74791.1 hypothetical protein CLOP_g5329 [Closterium sp. NIES-67]